MRQCGHFGRICLILAVVLVPTPAMASRLDGALDALAFGEQHLDVSWVPMYQNALKAGADTGNYSLDAIGTFTFAVAFITWFVMRRTSGIRLKRHHEHTGGDLVEVGMRAYNLG